MTMATVYEKKLKKGSEFYVIQQYLKENGTKAQKWHRCSSREEAERIHPEVEKAEHAGKIWHKPLYPTKSAIFYSNRAEGISMVVEELVSMYFKQQCDDGYWRAKTAGGYRGVINHYIIPFIGAEPIENVTTHYIQEYFRDLMTRNSVKKKKGEYVNISPRTIRDVKKVLNPAFQLAIQMGLREDNPVTNARLPRESKKSPPQWTPAEAVKALQNCDDFEILLMISLMISGPMRVGELLALRWSDIHSDADDNVGKLEIHCTLERVNKRDAELTHMMIHLVFPEIKKNCSTMLVLADVKNDYSFRADYLPPTVMAMLAIHRKKHEEWKKEYGEIQPDYDLVFHQDSGRPVTDKILSKRFHKHISFGTMQSVVFRSLRNTGATTQMQVSGNDIKAVQANMGHATADMLMEHYLGVDDGKRRELALQMENEIFSRLDLSAFGLNPPQNGKRKTPKQKQHEQTGTNVKK